MIQKKMIRTQIQLHSEQIKWLKKHALEEGISMSQAIRDSIDFYRLHVEQTQNLQSKKKNALKAVGSFSAKPAKSKELAWLATDLISHRSVKTFKKLIGHRPTQTHTDVFSCGPRRRKGVIASR